MAYYCGIDLGTTNSTISVIDIVRWTDDPMKKLSTIPIYQYDRSFNGIVRNETLLPSFLYFIVDEKKVYTGYYAKSVYAMGNSPMQTVTAVKTRIGSESIVEIPAVGSDTVEHFDMTQCSALLLKTIMNSFQEQYGEPIENVVITVPAAFNTDEREATVRAAKMAGFQNPRILDEPTATLLYFINGGESDFLSGNHLDDEESSYVMVYDLGGGTLDVCIARVSTDDGGDTSIDIISRSPREDFGGNDFDQLLAAYFLYEWDRARIPIQERNKEDQNAIISRLVSRAEEYKIKLNERVLDRWDHPRQLARVKTEAVFEVMDGAKVDLTLSKDTLDQVYLTITQANGPILKPVRYCLAEAGLDVSQISMVVLTGGMTKYYAVRQKLEEFFGGSVPLVEVDAQNSVSKGAAIHCYNESPDTTGRLHRLKLTDRMADDIFIKLNGRFEKLISRDVTCGMGTFVYEIPEDKMLKIPIFLYHGLNERDPADFTPIAGKYLYLKERLSGELKKGDRITLQWELDENKIVHITLAELDERLEVGGNADTFNMEELRLMREYQVNP